ncbi:hypothetical protein CLU79DRAFT_734901 [Phycomyces nitens]|nr:hypothetical protein CLU79DRAFT_734901 [Phycomyces nitens]
MLTRKFSGLESVKSGQLSNDKKGPIMLPTEDPNFVHSARTPHKNHPELQKAIQDFSIEYRSQPPIERTMGDSYVEKHLLLKSCPKSNAQYTNSEGTIDFGLLLQDVDDIGGVVVTRHTEWLGHSDICTPYTIGTEQIYMSIPNMVNDYKLVGHVAYTKGGLMVCFVGMEILWEKPFSTDPRIFHPKDTPDLGVPNSSIVAIFSATFLMVSKISKKSVAVSQIRCSSHQEEYLQNQLRLIYSHRHQIVKNIKARAQLYTDTTELDYKSNPKIYEIPLQSDGFNLDFVFISDTMTESSYIASPHQRNTNGAMFGGYVARASYDLACNGASCFLHSSAFRVVQLNDSTFKLPIAIGDYVHSKAQVIYSTKSLDNHFIIRVVVEVRNPKDLDFKTAYIMHLTFAVTNPTVKRKIVLPKTFKESIIWDRGYEIAHEQGGYALDFINKIRDNRLGACKL